MWLGIDFGTTNSGISFSDGERVHTFQIDEQHPDLLPSLIYITKNFENYVGTAARDQYLTKNVNRPSRFVPMEVGIIRLDVGDFGGYIEIDQAVTVMVDVLSPGRLLRSIKTGLRTIEYDSSVLFGRTYKVEELISILLKYVCTVAESMIGEPVTQVVMGRPVKFSDDPAVDQRAEERIIEAARLAGIEEVRFLPEPIAAAWAYHRDFHRPTKTFIFDFGGGTLDLTVAELGGEDPKILATEGVLIGGDDMDKRLFESLLPTFGKGAKLTIERLDGTTFERPIPEHVWSSLLDWQTVEEMKRSDTLQLIEDASKSGNSSDPAGLQALHELVNRNLYYKLMRQVEKAKVALSQSDAATISFDEQSVHIDQQVTRSEFERLINNEFHTISKAIDAVVARSGVSFAEIEKVVPTGGSSQIPIFKQLLAEKFPHADFASKAERDMTGVVQGLGIYGADLDLKEDDSLWLMRRRLFDQIKAAPVRLPLQGGALEDSAEFSHAVVGINHQGGVEMLPWQSGKPIPDVAPVHLRTGLFGSKAGKIILGSTLSRFVVADLETLRAMTLNPAKTPHQMKLDHASAEEFIFAERWNRADNRPNVILVTRWGNVRAFQRRFVDQPLRDEGMWKLTLRGKADPPSALVSVHRHSKLILATAGGRLTKLWASKISVRGSKGLKLKSAEKVHALAVEEQTQFLVVFGDGSAERLYVDDLNFAPTAGSAGFWKYRKGNIVGLLPVDDKDTARGITQKGRRVELSLTDAHAYSGHNKTTSLDANDPLVSIWK